MKQDGLHKVRIEVGDAQMFTKVTIDGEEVRGLKRVWFEVGESRGPFKDREWSQPATVHVEFYGYVDADLTARLDLQEITPYVEAKAARG